MNYPAAPIQISAASMSWEESQRAYMLKFHSGLARGNGDGTYTAHFLMPLDNDAFKAQFVVFCAACHCMYNNRVDQRRITQGNRRRCKQSLYPQDCCCLLRHCLAAHPDLFLVSARRHWLFLRRPG